jgi:hypothetical protein
MSEYDDIIGIFQGDLIIKTAIELSLEDMRKNPWLIEDVFASLNENPILAKRYGMKEITRAKEFILNTNIPVYMHHRLDKMEYPCITISIGNSNEDKSLSTLGDASIAFEDYSPNEIGKPIKPIVSSFTPVSYDKDTGIVELPTDIPEYRYVGKGMLLADPKTGNAFEIIDKAGINGVQITAGSKLPKGKLVIIPQYPTYRARRERATSQEQYNIGCHAHGDPSLLIFLFSVVKYSLFRYREGLLEYNNFQLSNLSCTDMMRNEMMQEENIYSRWITLSGQVEESWVKTPKRFIEAIDLNDPDRDEGVVFKSGIKILSNKNTQTEEDDEVWVTIEQK